MPHQPYDEGGTNNVVKEIDTAQPNDRYLYGHDTRVCREAGVTEKFVLAKLAELEGY